MLKTMTAFAVLGLLVAPAPTRAQFTLGPGLAWHDDFDLGIGVWGSAPAPSIHENVSVGGDVAVFFPDSPRDDVDVEYLEINANLFYSFADPELTFTPFALGGLNIARFSVDEDVDLPGGFPFDRSNTDIGLNVGGGIAFGTTGSGIRPVVGAKIELGGGKGLVLFGGLGFPVGG